MSYFITSRSIERLLVFSLKVTKKGEKNFRRDLTYRMCMFNSLANLAIVLPVS